MEGREAASHIVGLTRADADQRLRAGLGNRQHAPTSRSYLAIIRENTLTYFNGMVLVGFVLLLVLGRWQDALFGIAAIANAGIGIAQEIRAKQLLDRLSIVTAPTARVLRDGDDWDLSPDDVVLGDVLILRAGDQVVADSVVLEAARLSVDESPLTGEAEPVERGVGELVLSGTAILGGSALARVTAAGDESFAARLTAESRRFSLVRSELRESLGRLLRWVGWAVLPLALLVLNAQVQVQGGWASSVATGRWRVAAVDSVAALIAMIPLGLVLMTSVAFAVGAVALARHQVLVQELPAVEGLARVDVLCIDKTGTLTDGRVEVERVHLVGPPEWGVAGALGWFASDELAGTTVQSLAARFLAGEDLAALATIPFSSTRKWSAVTLDGAAEGTWVLGAPELIGALPEFGAPIPRAAIPGAAAEAGAEASRDDEGAALDEAARLAGTGLRTMLLAYTPSPLSGDDVKDERPPTGLRAAAVLAFREQLRPDAAETLAYFRREGIDVRVLSGDGASTAAAVARAAGLPSVSAMDAGELPDDDEGLVRAVLAHRVLGRVTPAQKRSIVRALQSAGHTVAMTGDGVNDALAVKEADLGIAMGSGAPATRAVSRIVLLDDEFAHLPDVVLQGRKVMANIERVAVLFLTKTAYAVVLSAVLGLLALVSAAFLETPFLPRQLSVTDGLTIGVPAFFLALIPNDRRYRRGFLRRALRASVPNGVLIAACFVALSLVGSGAGLPIAQVRTVATLVLTVLGLWVLAGQSRPLTGLRLAVVLAMPIAGALLFAFPPASAFLDFESPPPWYAALGGGICLVGCAGITVLRLAGRRLTAPSAP